MQFYDPNYEKSSCGVGFIASRHTNYSYEIIQQTLHALKCEEHRGACSADQITGDGAGVMLDIPFELLGYQRQTIALATLFAPQNREKRRKSLRIFEDTFAFMGMKVLEYREVPVNPEVLGEEARKGMPYIIHAILDRPAHCRTNTSFDKLLYVTKQYTRTKLKQDGACELFFASLSANTVVYKGLCKSKDLDRFYLDLQNPAFKSRFGLFHRRFSTNTSTSWDKAQPFRLIGHNGEINTITGNRSWALSREMTLGLFDGELLTHEGVSDSGSLNEMVEALKYRSSIPRLGEILAIMMPPAHQDNSFYQFWSRVMEPWDGPALITYSNGRSLGARLDRNGFRPCRWAMTNDYFYLSSEAGSFQVNEKDILQKGTLQAGTGVHFNLNTGKEDFTDPSQTPENFDFNFDHRTFTLPYSNTEQETPQHLHKKHLFNYTKEDYSKILIPMITDGKEPIGSMGDTARLAVFSSEPRSFFDYFCHNFAQVTNPPLDYLRERYVTDLKTYLGRQPNIFAKKDLIPPPTALELPSPILSLKQMEYVASLNAHNTSSKVISKVFDISFKREYGAVGCQNRLDQLNKEVKKAIIEEDVSVVILSDQNADYDHPPIPVLLALRSVVEHMRQSGLRLKFSLVIHSGEIRTTHHVATTIGMGAAAVCPYLALEVARYEDDKKLAKLSPVEKEQNLVKAYENGLLKIMSKMGISVVRSYQSSQLFTSIGISCQLIERYFSGVTCVLSGIGLKGIVDNVLRNTEQAKQAQEDDKLINNYLFKEHARGQAGEKHSMTNVRSKVVHELVRSEGDTDTDQKLYKDYLDLGHNDEPVHIRHLFQLKAAKNTSEGALQSKEDILSKFGSGAMSFGALSAEAQRDIFLAMREIGGRSNSGEGGENPYYYTEGISATAKQVASGRFGVNALYLVSGDEVQIKIAQGAKPGEGGQLMGKKVNAEIAFARHSSEGVDLISPPPLHDIYSIEDLKQLIYELKQLKPGIKVTVKLVSGAGIGTVAVGVAKAGADVIHVSGGDGGTGAASLSSMKHAGLPWEFGLWAVHQALVHNKLRGGVVLRTDGSLATGKDIVMAAILGAEEYDFGKLLLIAQGCVMARVCEKNTCPTGIATHAERFKAKYKGTKEHIVKMMHFIAEDVQKELKAIGQPSLESIIGNTDLLGANPAHASLIREKELDLGFFLAEPIPYNPINEHFESPFVDEANVVNQEMVKAAQVSLSQNVPLSLNYEVMAVDRAVLATLAGAIALRQHQNIHHKFDPAKANSEAPTPYTQKITATFTGSAGQGFGVFMVDNLDVTLYGEANDSVAKGMSGGKMVIRPHREASFAPEDNVIIGNCALYGATGGTLFVSGLAGDRFAVRNSGALAVVEGVGLHACEYMTQGKVIILGTTSYNIGGGMTGGEVIVFGQKEKFINQEYLQKYPLNEEELRELKKNIEHYHYATHSQRAAALLAEWEAVQYSFQRYLPIGMVKKREEVKEVVNVPVA
jgi:glutamate synthase domain-containing protein 2/glutamate synthase domain-containing protein 1/glutamate synthase domain-containing protein 3